MNSIEKSIRKLARSQYWQELYCASRECSGIFLFINQSNFSGLQYMMLYWLRVYRLLYTELAQKDWEQLDQELINDDDRVDAFLYWRSKQIDKKLKEYKNTPKKPKKRFGIWQGRKS